MAKKETEILNINISTELMDKVRSYADDMAINKTSAVAVLLSQALGNQKALSDMTELLKIMKDLQEREVASE